MRRLHESNLHAKVSLNGIELKFVLIGRVDPQLAHVETFGVGADGRVVIRAIRVQLKPLLPFAVADTVRIWVTEPGTARIEVYFVVRTTAVQHGNGIPLLSHLVNISSYFREFHEIILVNTPVLIVHKFRRGLAVFWQPEHIDATVPATKHLSLWVGIQLQMHLARIQQEADGVLRWEWRIECVLINVLVLQRRIRIQMT